MNEGGCRNGPSLFLRGFHEGTRREGSLQETPKDMPSKALEMGIFFHSIPVLENMEGCSFLRASKRREKFII